jgi:hypothetical protein
MLFNFATKDDIEHAFAELRIGISRLEEELKTLQRDYCGQYLRNMELQDKNIRSVQHLEDRILAVEKAKKKKPSAKAKK